MKKKFVRRIAAFVSAAVIGVGAVCMFAGCTSDYPEVTITYNFNGVDYEVKYILSREQAPETVQHFLELADTGFYDGTVIHDYDSNFLYGGGYTLEDGMLIEKDYFTFVTEYEEEEGYTFTQSVFKDEDLTIPLYTVVGEFAANLRGPEKSNYVHQKGALVMYYNDIGDYNVNFSYDVYVERADGGEENDGETIDCKLYRYNMTTSLFYTFLGDSRTDLDAKYAVIGIIDDYDEMEELLDAIADYVDGLDDDESFTTASEDLPSKLWLYKLDHPGDADFADLRNCGVQADYDTPITKPITVTSVVVDKW